MYLLGLMIQKSFGTFFLLPITVILRSFNTGTIIYYNDLLFFIHFALQQYAISENIYLPNSEYLYIILLNSSVEFFIYLKLKLLTQFPATNE